MTYRLLLDENVEHELVNRLSADGHDVIHVDGVAALGKGTADAEIARYSRETGRLVVTYDDDFVLGLDESAARGVLYVADSTLGGSELASANNRMSAQFPSRRCVESSISTDGDSRASPHPERATGSVLVRAAREVDCTAVGVERRARARTDRHEHPDPEPSCAALP